MSYYAALININAYHQPGVEAGKKAATEFLEILSKTEKFLADHLGEKLSTIQVAENIQESEEVSFHALHHLAANRKNIRAYIGQVPNDDKFVKN